MEATSAAGVRERLLAAAQKCLQEKGYARTSARDLVEASGTNLASIGYHFGGKEALLNEALAAGCREWLARTEQAVFDSDTADLAARLEQTLVARVDRAQEQRPLMMAFVEAFPPAFRSQALRDRLVEIIAESRQSTAAMVQRACQEIGISPGPHADTVAAILIALCDGLMLQLLLDHDNTPDSRQIMDALQLMFPLLAGSAGTPHD